MRWLLWLPLTLFVVIVAVVMAGLIRPASTDIRSQLINRPVPDFALPAAISSHPPLSRADLAGGPKLLNVFASWCVPCAVEAPQLMALKRAGVTIDGIAIRDKPQDLSDFLARNGDPYGRIGADKNSHVQLALGSSGVPESFIIDSHGVIRSQHLGDIRPEEVPAILAAIQAAR